MADFNIAKTEPTKAESPKAVRALEISHRLVTALSNEITSLEKRLEHVSQPNNMIEMAAKKESPVPSEPNSSFVTGLYDLNGNLQELSNRINNILELLEI